MQSNSENNNSVAAVVAALVTRRSSSNENNSHSAMRVYLDKLRDLVPHCPKNRNVSKLELIQYVIDYINDLQETLNNSNDPDSPPSSPSPNPLSFTEAFSHLSFSEEGEASAAVVDPVPTYEDFPKATSYTSDGSSDYDSRGSSPINNSDTDYSGDECTHPSQHYSGPYFTNSLPLQVSSTNPSAATPTAYSSGIPSNNDPRRLFRKGYGLPAHMSG